MDMDEHDDPAVAAVLEFNRRMADRFQHVANVFYQNGIPKEQVSSVFFAAGVDALLITFERGKVIEMLETAIRDVMDIDEDEIKANIIPCEGSA